MYDMTQDVQDLINKGASGTIEMQEKVSLLTVKFQELKRELVQIIEKKIDQIRFETRGAL